MSERIRPKEPCTGGAGRQTLGAGEHIHITNETVHAARGVLLRSALLMLTALLFAGGASADDETKGTGTQEDPYVVSKCSTPIKVDGVLDEAGWEDAASVLLLYEYVPGDNLPAPVRTEFLVTYDDNNVYFGFRCDEPEPSAIRAYYVNRDTIWSGDWVGVTLEAFNDGRRAYIFGCNPVGIQGDGMWETANPGLSFSWDGIWNAAARMHDWGYSIEMAVPFNQLNFERSEDDQIWAITAERCYPRVAWRVMGMFRLTDRNLSRWLFMLPKFKGFKGASPGRNIEINPTLTAAQTDSKDRLPAEDFTRTRKDADLGLTARWGITPNLTTVFTANPDFSQVEADALQLDINEPFALFYPEKRPFFTEGADFFSTKLKVLHTRTLREPEWGLKFAGKGGANTLGAFLLRDELTNLVFPGSTTSTATSLAMPNTSSVIRYKRDLGPNYTIGIIGTDREGADYHNRVLGLDGFFQLSDADRLSFELLGSGTCYPRAISEAFDQPLGDFSDRAFFLAFDHNTQNYDLGAVLADIGPRFRADLGYLPQVDYRLFRAAGLYRWIPTEATWHWGMEAGGGYEQLHDHDGLLLFRRAFLEYAYNGPKYIETRFKLSRLREQFNGSFFDQNDFTWESSFRPVEDHAVGLSGSFGDRVDYANTRLGKRLRLWPGISSQLWRHLQVEFSHLFERLSVDGGRLYIANSSMLTLNYQFSARAFLRSIIQYIDYRRDVRLYTFPIDSVYKRLSSQLLFSYQLNPRTVLYLGYSDNHLGGPDFDLNQADRTLFIKLGYAWIM